MTAIPKVTAEACKEAYYKIINKNSKMLEIEDLKKHLHKVSDEFTKKQPEIQIFVSKLIDGHMSQTNGVIGAAQFALYVMIAVESIYIQEEIDDVKKLFNEGNDE